MLFQLKENEYDKVKYLVEDINHNHVVVNTMVNGLTDGIIIVDNQERPTNALFCPDGGFYYIVSRENQQTFFQSLSTLFFDEWKVDILELIFFPNELMSDLSLILGKRKHIALVRNEYIIDEIHFNKVQVSKLEAPYELKKITEDIIKTYSIDLETWPTIDRFLKNSLGYCIIKENNLVSQCLGYFNCSKEIELGIKTDEAYRKQGFGSIVTQALIEDALKQGLAPIWSCWDFNEASNNLAKKMGFTLSNQKKAVIWDHYIDKQE